MPISGSGLGSKERPDSAEGLSFLTPYSPYCWPLTFSASVRVIGYQLVPDLYPG